MANNQSKANGPFRKPVSDKERYHLALAQAVEEAIENASVLELDDVEGFLRLCASMHEPDDVRTGCTCGFVAWSAEHVVVMSWRAALRRLRTFNA